MIQFASVVAALSAVACAIAVQGGAVPQGEPAKADIPPVTERMKSGAAALDPTVRSELAKRFLAATVKLSNPGTRTIYRDRDKGIAVSKRAFDAMPAEERASLKPRECTPDFYFETGYGSPLVYVRTLDLAAPHMPTEKGGAAPKVLDFGYGTIGHLQLLAHCGIDAYGVDVEPVFPALYSEPQDTGRIGSGSVSIHKGQWPAEPRLRDAIGGGYSLITSKNTLKNGYIHPSPPEGQTADPARMVQLGVPDDEFLARVHAALKPGGVFLIYNICPPQNPPDKEYLLWADGTSPFTRAAYETAGFEVIAFDARDEDWVIDCFGKLGYTEGKSREEVAKEYFCWYTLVRRKP